MKLSVSLLFFLFLGWSVKSQGVLENKKSPDLMELNDAIEDTVQLEEIVIGKDKAAAQIDKSFIILRNRVYVTYPYAKIAAERLTALNSGMELLKTNKEKKKYFKIIENYLTNEFEAQLKKLSRGQGRILVKLIHRQTGSTTFDLIKNLKSSWKAFWSNTAASLFDINLKSEYTPYSVNEDYLIESILQDAFDSKRMINQPPAHPINRNELDAYWENKAEQLKKTSPAQ